MYDNVVGDNEINIQNRITSGSGHGWAGAQNLLWNCAAPSIVIQSPPGHYNWAIGCKGNVTGTGSWYTGNGYEESTGNFVEPQSLYEKQLCDRLGRVCKEEENKPKFQDYFIYPNPTFDGIINISFSNRDTSLKEVIQVISMTGQTLGELELDKNNQLHFQGYAKRPYILRFSVGGKYIYKRIFLK